MSHFGVILVAAGRSTRFGDKNYKKPFAPLLDRSVWLHSAERFQARDDVVQTIIVIAEEDREEFTRKFGANLAFMGIDMCVGGDQRTDSVRAGLDKLNDKPNFVAIHDAARPCISDDEIERVFAKAVETEAAILATPVAATLKRGEAADGQVTITETVSRENLWQAQTPQVFSRELIQQAYQSVHDSLTDDAQMVERLGKQVALIEGKPSNIKLTNKADLKLAEMILKSRPRPKPDGSANPFAGDDLWR